jgi:LysM repeat protein
MSTLEPMKILAIGVLAVFLSTQASAQTPNDKSSAAQLEAINKKLDEQNAKIDALSQQILKLQEQMSKPGVVIGETASAPAPSPTVTASVAEPVHGSGNTHTVMRGETLTSIARQYKVSVDELQKFNHIEDGRKLQAGQTIMIPIPGAASPVPSAEPSRVPND